MKTFELIKERRSVRTFSGKPLSKDDALKIKEFAEKAENPYGLHIDWILLDAKSNGLKTPVIVGEDTYIAGKMKRAPHAEEAFGYSFEKTVIYAQSLGVGTTWIAGTMDRALFEKAISLDDSEVMPCISPLGYPAAKMSVREGIMRKGVKADSRFDFSDIFYDSSFEKTLKKENAGKWEQALESVRLAPSAVNKQPWRAVVCDNCVHFYEKCSKPRKENEWDIQKIDMGIALCHFETVAEDSGIPVSFIIENPGFTDDEDLNYIATYIVE